MIVSNCHSGGVSHNYIQLFGMYVKTDDFEGLSTRVQYGTNPDSLDDGYVFTGYGHIALFIPPDRIFPVYRAVDSIVQKNYHICQLGNEKELFDSIDSIPAYYELHFSKGDIIRGPTELDYVVKKNIINDTNYTNDSIVYSDYNDNIYNLKKSKILFPQYDEKKDNIFYYSFSLFIHKLLLFPHRL